MSNDERRRRILPVAVVIVILAGLGSIVAFGHFMIHDALASKDNSAKAEGHLHSGSRGLKPPASPAAQAGTPAKSEFELFSASVLHLHEALAQFPGTSREDVILRVNSTSRAGTARPCPFEWQNGEAEMTVAPANLQRVSLPSAIETCAQAIDGLPR